jgi:hypothetical protein
MASTRKCLPARLLRSGVILVLAFVPSCPAEDGMAVPALQRARPFPQAFVPSGLASASHVEKHATAPGGTALPTSRNTQLRQAPARASRLSPLRMTGGVGSWHRIAASEARWRVAVFHIIVTFSTAVLEVADVALRVALFAFHAFRAVLYAVGLRAVTTGSSAAVPPFRHVRSFSQKAIS